MLFKGFFFVFHFSKNNPEKRRKEEKKDKDDSDCISSFFSSLFLVLMTLFLVYILLYQFKFFAREGVEEDFPFFKEMSDRFNERPKTNNIEQQLFVELEEIYQGAQVNIHTKTQLVCEACGGQGGSGKRVCSQCRGRGHVVKMMRMGGIQYQMQSECGACGGSGKEFEKVCERCGGHKMYVDEVQHLVSVPCGHEEGRPLILKGKSHQHVDADPGDVLIYVRSRPHGFFERHGSDLKANLTISLLEALTGFNRHIIHLDGRKLPISSNQVTQDKQVMVIEGEGMPIPNDSKSKGTLYVTFKVSGFPRRLSEEQKRSEWIIFYFTFFLASNFLTNPKKQQ